MRDQTQWSDYQDRINRVVDYIHDHLDDDLDLDTLAEVACLSRYHWHRVFHALKGETVAQLVERLRLARAARQLTSTDDPVADIARVSGFNSARAFSRSFGKAYGMSPARYRRAGAHAVFQSAKTQGNSTMFDVDIIDAPKRALHGFAHVGDYMGISRQFEHTFSTIAAQGLLPNMRGMVGIYYNDPSATPVDELQSFAGVLLEPGTPVPDALETRELASGPVAVLHYKGPYSGMKPAYDWFYGTWLASSGREAGDMPPYEVYLNSPEDTAPNDLLTEIHLPLK
ncbi:MAG: GyrI-like domain-containing protein [Pseudomonadota bacterium]